MEDKYQADFFVFDAFCHCPYLISKKYFQNFRCLYLGQMCATKATNASSVGPKHTR